MNAYLLLACSLCPPCVKISDTRGLARSDCDFRDFAVYKGLSINSPLLALALPVEH